MKKGILIFSINHERLINDYFKSLEKSGRQVGLFRCPINIQKKVFTIQLKNYGKKLNNLWQQGQHKKAAQLYFHCGALGKVIDRKMKNIYKDETQKVLKRFLNS